ncbi:MAG: DNA mismatch repair protein MutL [Candidatus Tokpelaia sp. JSC189]|nr:MAG: DNA mismatch repair protein MutL [Candidatus Tokpelaia sp. JSC189]
MTIRQLSKSIINQIAAGEIVERPASIVKELVENAIDASATRIGIVTAGGGKNLIRVTDDGRGIKENELILAISRHCTSKLSDNIYDIHALGFRGEALASIGSVSRLRLLSRAENAAIGAEILVSGGRIEGPRPAASNCGTTAEVCDLFYTTPARLKFMKTDRAEIIAVTDTIKRIAIAFPHIHFTLSGPDRNLTEFAATGIGPQAQTMRLAQILGKEFTDNTIELDAKRKGIRLTGFASIPSYNRGNSLQQFVYVNGRSIRDKMLSGAIKSAYSDVIARNRYSIIALFLEIDPTDIDINVHPAKSDVRFRDPHLVRGFVISSIRMALKQAGIRPTSTSTIAMLNAFQPHISPVASTYFSPPASLSDSYYRPSTASWIPETAYPTDRPIIAQSQTFKEHSIPVLQDMQILSADLMSAPIEITHTSTLYPLGTARAQIHQNYIVAQTKDSLIIVDQHAAHERLVYEALKQALYAKPLASQILLMPEIVELPEEDAGRLLEHTATLQKFGLFIKSFGPSAIAVQETPAMLGEVNAASLVQDLAEEIAEHETADGLKAMLDYIAATMACHSSIRSGRILKAEEMNALLRQMEEIPESGTCNHGRPTYIELKLADIERLFKRR